MEDKIKLLMCELFVCTQDEINESTMRTDLENWDSLQHLIFISRIEQEFSIKLSPEEINSINSYKNIIEIIKKNK